MRILKGETALLVVDLQEKLMPVIDQSDEVIRRTAMLIEGLKQFHVPVVVLRQYPKGLGDTHETVRAALGDHTPFDKLAYSAMQDAAIVAKMRELKSQGIKNVIVCGVESHICVLQSCIDLMAEGLQAILIADAVGSRNAYDKKIALKRAMQENILLSTVESVLFELCMAAGTDEFKVISKLVR